MQEIVEWEPESLERSLPTIDRILEGAEHNDFELSFFHPDGSLRTLNIISHAIKDTAGNVTLVEGIATDITGKPLVEPAQGNINKILEAKIEDRTHELENLNTALAVLLKKREEDKLELEERIFDNFESIIKPFIEKLKAGGNNKDHQTLVRILESNLEEIISPFSKKLSDPMQNLTPSEIKVASLIRQGLSNKEIATTLGNSIRTVTNHRNHIRRKLGLVNKKVNLRSFLSSI